MDTKELLLKYTGEFINKLHNYNPSGIYEFEHNLNEVNLKQIEIYTGCKLSEGTRTLPDLSTMIILIEDEFQEYIFNIKNQLRIVSLSISDTKEISLLTKNLIKKLDDAIEHIEDKRIENYNYAEEAKEEEEKHLFKIDPNTGNKKTINPTLNKDYDYLKGLSMLLLPAQKIEKHDIEFYKSYEDMAHMYWWFKKELLNLKDYINNSGFLDYQPEPDNITANSNQQKCMLLFHFGIVEYLEKTHKLSKNQCSKVLGTLTEINWSTILRTYNAYNTGKTGISNTNNKNTPDNENNRIWLTNLLNEYKIKTDK